MRGRRALLAAAALAAASLALVGPAAATVPGSAFTWIQRSPATSPPARVAAAMAFDAAGEEVVMFGGETESFDALGDTWTWDGTDWTERSLGAGPPARGGAAMAYDAATEEVVLFGGEGGSGLLGDTWTWDGNGWTRRSPVVGPPPRSAATMTYDAATREVVLFGGSAEGSFLHDTWSYAPLVKNSQSLTFPAIPDHILGDPDFDPAASASSGLPVTYTFQTPSVCTIVSAHVHLLAAGECTVTAEQPGDAEYDAAESLARSFRVSPAPPVERPASPPPTAPPAVVSPTTLRILIHHTPDTPHRPNPRGGPRWTFVFTDAAPGVTFLCRLDGAPFRPCHSPTVYRHLRRGPHVFRVHSIDAAGEESPTRLVRFLVGPRRGGGPR